jgi:hypothetical protein
MASTSWNLYIGQNQVKRSIDAIVLKKVILVCYTCVQHRSCAVLGLVSISWYASFTKKQRASVRTRKWHDSRYVRLKASSGNLVLILDILLVWLGDAFYRTGGSSWIFWMWFHWKGCTHTWSNAKSSQVMGSSYQDKLFAKMINMDI